MGGFSSVTGDETIMFADNASFDGTQRGGKMTLDGQLFIGSTVSPHVRVGNISNSGTTVRMTGGHGTITQNFAIANIVFGNSLPSLTSGSVNYGIGLNIFQNLTSGAFNIACGLNALNAATTSNSNIGIGTSVLSAITTGIGLNTAIGSSALQTITIGTQNTALGFNAGNSYTTSESSNIVIRNTGTLGESNVIRIGTQGSGGGQQNACYIAGITGTTVSSSNFVGVNASGQLSDLGIAYATGTWTPTLVGNSSAGTTNYSSQNGYYTQIGNLVTVIGTINFTSATGTGNILIGGLPFTIKSQTQGNTIGSILVSSAGLTWPGGTTNTVLYGQLNTTTCEIYCTGSGSAGGFMQLANTSGGISFTLTYQI